MKSDLLETESELIKKHENPTIEYKYLSLIKNSKIVANTLTNNIVNALDYSAILMSIIVLSGIMFTYSAEVLSER